MSNTLAHRIAGLHRAYFWAYGTTIRNFITPTWTAMVVATDESGEFWAMTIVAPQGFAFGSYAPGIVWHASFLPFVTQWHVVEAAA